MCIIKIINTNRKFSSPAIIVIADGQPLGEIVGREEIKQFKIKPGNHALEVKVDSYISDKCYFTISSEETKIYSVKIRNHSSDVDSFTSGILPLDFIVNAFILLYYFTIGQRRFITIREEIQPA